MAPSEAKRRLLWHGILIVLLGLASGVLVPILANPRMGVAAHVGGVMSGLLLLLVGLFWQELHLAERTEKLTFWLFLYASYSGWLAQLLAAAFGTSWATPIAGAGFRGADWQEYLVYVIAVSFSAAISIACGLALWGLRRPTKSMTARQ
jgi:hydroxylaminobenzene mutase